MPDASPRAPARSRSSSVASCERGFLKEPLPLFVCISVCVCVCVGVCVYVWERSARVRDKPMGALDAENSFACPDVVTLSLSRASERGNAIFRVAISGLFRCRCREGGRRELFSFWRSFRKVSCATAAATASFSRFEPS